MKVLILVIAPKTQIRSDVFLRTYLFVCMYSQKSTDNKQKSKNFKHLQNRRACGLYFCINIYFSVGLEPETYKKEAYVKVKCKRGLTRPSFASCSIKRLPILKTSKI